MRAIKFSPLAFDQFTDWGNEDIKTFKKIRDLIVEIARKPFKGTGKPEPLKGNYKGCWSRRITKEHRLIYKVHNDNVIILSCFGHYDD